MKPDLSDVTVCTADCITPLLAARSLARSASLCAFADAILFTDTPVDGPFRSVRIDKLGSSVDYSRFVMTRLPATIETPFVLVTQWDGFVVDPGAWRAEFRQYDYIGAKWDWHKDSLRVGNGGFSLRSQKLLRALADPRFPPIETATEDNLICRLYRPALESDYGIRFAPESVADLFSYEHTPPDAPTFGFHGLANIWRHMEDREVIETIGHLGPSAVRMRDYIELLMQYVMLRKFGPLHVLYAKLRAEVALDEIPLLLATAINNPTFIQHCVRVCEPLLARPR